MVIEANLRDVRRRVAEAAGRVGRDPAEITLVAVTKLFTVDHIQAAYDLGVRHFGENRVHEAAEKIPIVNQWIEEHAFSPITWHMIGHLQSRKAKDAIRLFDVIHSVDTLKLAERLDHLCQPEGKIVPILLEVNVSGEESKYGFALERWEEDEKQREHFFTVVEEILALPQVEVQGLMTMAPIMADPEKARPCFRSLRRLWDALAERFPRGHWRHLSMGMTDDFEEAIEEGATMVRIGRAIFGERRA
jgi:pyridoxal phosphate enzyme (YggS family)